MEFAVRIEGGGLAMLDDQYLLVAGDGIIYMFDFNDDESIRARQLAFSAPLNRAQFKENVDERVNGQHYFRVGGVAVRENVDGLHELFVLHHYWYQEKQC